MLEGLKVVPIKTEQKLLLYARVILALGWDILGAFIRKRQDYVRKDLGVLGLTMVDEFSVAWKLLLFVDRDRQIRLCLVFHTMCRHAGFWLGELGGGKESRPRSVWQQRAVRAALCVLLFVLCILICIVVVTVPFVSCSVKLPLSRPTSFCLFLSILLHTPAGGGAAAWPLCCWLQPNYDKFEKFLTERPSLIHSTDRHMIHADLKWFFWRPHNTETLNSGLLNANSVLVDCFCYADASNFCPWRFFPHLRRSDP